MRSIEVDDHKKPNIEKADYCRRKASVIIYREKIKKAQKAQKAQKPRFCSIR